jgi:hypothetical protein
MITGLLQNQPQSFM